MNSTESHRDKRKSVVEMMTTIHSSLVHKYKLFSTLLDAFLVVTSVTLLVFTFVDPVILESFGLGQVFARFVIGSASIVVCVLSILSYVVDWRGRSVRHEQAFRTLIDLNAEWRLVSTLGEETSVEVLDLDKKTTLLMNQMITINDKHFNALKSKHFKKVAIGKILSQNPSISILTLKIALLIKDTQVALRQLKEKHPKETEATP